MKPASIVSLIVAAVLIILGFVGCYVAKNMAEKNGESLFSEEIDGNVIRAVDLTENDISKISLIADNVTVHIIGECDKLDEDDPAYRTSSSIEFVNFPANYYSLNVSNRVLSFDEIPDIASMLKFWENGFSFKGMRYLLNFDRKPDTAKERIINVYLCSGREIKIFDIQAKACSLSVSNMTTGTDYNLTADELSLDVTNLRTTSTMNINTDATPAKTVTVTMKTRAYLNSIRINAEELNLNAEYFRATNAVDLTCKTGVITVQSVTPSADISLDLRSDAGTITVDGKEVHSPYAHANPDNASAASVRIKTDCASVNWIGPASEES